MPNIPEPVQTPQGPAYEGRLLDRADEEVVDQGAAFDIRTLVSRRGMLGLVGLGVGSLALAACAPLVTKTATPSATATESSSSSAGVTPGEIPDETAGPYPGDGSNGPDVLEGSGIVRQDIRSSIDGSATADGVPLDFELQVLDLANGGVPFAGVAVYAWHCTAQGEYSMYSSGLENATYLRGVQVADADGRVSFTSIFPDATPGAGPTSTSRCTPTSPRSPTLPMRSPPRSSRCRRTRARRSTRTRATTDRPGISHRSHWPATTCSATTRERFRSPPSPAM